MKPLFSAFAEIREFGAQLLMSNGHRLSDDSTKFKERGGTDAVSHDRFGAVLLTMGLFWFITAPALEAKMDSMSKDRSLFW